MDLSKISPIALLCAKAKAEYTDLPYALQIYSLASQNQKWMKGVDMGLVKKSLDSDISGISILEGRHLAINHALNELPDYTVLELGGGLSSRGLEMKDRHYIETDLPNMALLKKDIVNKLRKNCETNPHYRVFSLNPLHADEFISFGKALFQKRKSPVAIINEGLMMYLSTEEQRQLMQNIALFLEKYCPSGYWITSDLSSRPLPKEDNMNVVMNHIEQITGRPFNRFNSDSEAHEFLRSANMNGVTLPSTHLVDKLSCLRKLNISRENAESVCGLYRAWKISLN